MHHYSTVLPWGWNHWGMEEERVQVRVRLSYKHAPWRWYMSYAGGQAVTNGLVSWDDHHLSSGDISPNEIKPSCMWLCGDQLDQGSLGWRRARGLWTPRVKSRRWHWTGVQVFDRLNLTLPFKANHRRRNDTFLSVHVKMSFSFDLVKGAVQGLFAMLDCPSKVQDPSPLDL